MPFYSSVNDRMFKSKVNLYCCISDAFLSVLVLLFQNKNCFLFPKVIS